MSSEVFKICGHSRPMGYLERLKKSGRIGHALLLSGPDGVGKKTIALRFVAGLFCVERSASREQHFGCGLCPECLSIINVNHPDFLFYFGDEPIGIENIKEARRRLRFYSSRGAFRGLIIDNAHRLTPDAQGALLKILEEPGENTIFFFITDRPHLLLDTVRSRMLNIAFGTVSDEDLKVWLNEIEQPSGRDHNFVIEFADGRPGRVKHFLENPEDIHKERSRRAKFDVILTKNAVDQFLFSDALTADGDEAAKEFLRHLIVRARQQIFGGNSKAAAALVRFFLELYASFETTNVNRRLITDSSIIEASDL